MKKEKTTIQESTAKSNVLPEFIAGIPTAKHRSKERMDLIRSYYQRLWKKLQREGRINKIFNDYLGVDVFIIENESDKKTINTASKNWQSTYAVRQKRELKRKTVIKTWLFYITIFSARKKL